MSIISHRIHDDMLITVEDDIANVISQTNMYGDFGPSRMGIFQGMYF